MNQKTDVELYKEFLNGNQNSFEQIILKYKDKIIYFINKYVKNIDTSEDLAQDVFVYILIHKINYDFKYSLKTYLFTIAKSKAFNYIKRSKKIIYTENIEYEEEQELEEKVFNIQRKENLKNSINKLKPEYQKAIYLADIEQLSYEEIGNILEKNNSQIKSLIYRARKSLKKVIRREEFEYEE